ncbi:uncharacterized protein LOC131671727 [Phymastichus coffea]|uniref:uncharacterized protein LOC131671727 n=1 Tax=Phymastichus coffea TaxID=108790 RepID=UPI00273C07F0|nr:uncharacterized protein LOC131671727 [Phymastichus coffea]
MNQLKIIRYCLFNIVITALAILNYNLAFGSQLEFVGEIIKKNIQISRISVFVKRAKNLSPTSSILLGQLSSRFSCVYIEMHRFQSIVDDGKYNCVLNTLCQRIERDVKIVLIDTHGRINIENELMEIIDFLIVYSPQTVRPRCLIVIISNIYNENFLSFFEYGWLNDFLDITVLQITEQSNTSLMIPNNSNVIDVKMHTYNPFNKTYIVKELHDDVVIFDDKSLNLHKTVLKASFFKEFPDLIVDNSYTGDNLWNALKGQNVDLMNAVAANLNFSIKVTAAWDSYYDLSKFNVSYNPNALKNRLADFLSPGLTLKGFEAHDYKYEYCCFVSVDPNYIIVRQYGTKMLQLSFYYVGLSITGIAVIILFSVLLRRYYKSEFWSALNTAKILLRLQVAPAPRTVVEKYFMLFVTCLSILFVEHILEEIMNIYLIEDNYRELKTLQDLLDSGIIPSISKYTRDLINSKNSVYLKILSNKSRVLDSYGSTEDCVSQLIHNLNRVEGCEINRVLGEVAVKAYSKVKKGSILTLVEEPIFPGFMVVPFTKTSPYVRPINRVVTYLFDGGVVDYLHKTTMSILSLDKTKFYYPGNFPQNQGELALLYEGGNLESSHKSLLIFLTFTYILSIFVFAIEVILKIIK